jgi:BlaI family transcriptional regulator, penicillinase repressor
MPRGQARPDPTESELEILQVLWRRGPSSVREIWNELGQKSGYTTVLKFLQIMLEKGLVRRDERELTHVYKAAVGEDFTQTRAVTRLIDRAFGGSTSQLVLRALSAKPLSDQELKELRALLAEKEGKQK